jgi:serine/threonine protein kinase
MMHSQRYTQHSLLGEGSYGQVFLAYDHQVKRRVAIKKPFGGMGETLQHERLILSRLQPITGVAHLLDTIIFDTESDQEYLVLEYVAGQCMSNVDTQSLPLQRVIACITQFFSVMVQLHIIGIVHNDLRDENILLAREGSMYVIDFCRAQIVDSRSSVEFRRDVYDMLVIAESWLCSLPRQCSRQTRRILLTWLAEQQEAHHDIVLSASSMLTNWQRLTMQSLQTPAPVSSLSA